MGKRLLSLSEMQQLNSGILPDEKRERLVTDETTGKIYITTPAKKGNNNVATNQKAVVTDDMTSEEMIQEIEATQPELLGNKPVKEVKPSRKDEKAQAEKEWRESFELVQVPLDQIEHKVSLSSLIPLEATPIPGAKRAMREINKEHLEEMIIAYRNGKTFPKIKVQASTHGFIIYGGMHRTAVYENAVLDLMAEAGYTETSPLPTDVNWDTLHNTFRDNFEIDVIEGQFTTNRELIRAARVDNLDNGLGMSQNSRSELAVWLLEDAKEHGEKLSVTAAADMAHVSRIAVHRFMQRQREKDAKMIDALLEPEELTELDEVGKEVKKDKDTSKTEGDAKNLLKSMMSLHTALKLQHTDEMVEYLSDYLESFGMSVQLDTYQIFADALLRLHGRLSKPANKKQQAAIEVTNNDAYIPTDASGKEETYQP